MNSLGERYAHESNIPIRRFILDWNKFGRKAGILRNQEMGDYDDALIDIWDCKRRGTMRPVDYAKKKELNVL